MSWESRSHSSGWVSWDIRWRGHLAAGGHEVTVYNRSTDKADKWVKEHGGNSVATPKEAAAAADYIFICVGNDDDLRSVTTGVDGVFHGMADGAVIIDNTTASSDVAKELHAAAGAKGCGFP